MPHLISRIVDHIMLTLTFTSYAFAIEEEVAMAANTEEMNKSFIVNVVCDEVYESI